MQNSTLIAFGLLGLFAIVLTTAQDPDEEKIRKALENSKSRFDVLSDCEICDEVVSKLKNRSLAHDKLNHSNHSIKDDLEAQFGTFWFTVCQMVNRTNITRDVSKQLQKNIRIVEEIKQELESKVSNYSIESQNGLRDFNTEIRHVIGLELSRVLEKMEETMIKEIDWYETLTREQYCHEFNLTETRKNVSFLMLNRVGPFFHLIHNITMQKRLHQDLWRVQKEKKDNETAVEEINSQLVRIEGELSKALDDLEKLFTEFRDEIATQWKQLLSEQPTLEKTLVARLLKMAVYDLLDALIRTVHFMQQRVRTVQSSSRDVYIN